MRRFFLLLLFFVLGVAVVGSIFAYWLREDLKDIAFLVSAGINFLLLAFLYMFSEGRGGSTESTDAPKKEETLEEFEDKEME